MFSIGSFEFDFLGDGDAVLSDRRRAEFPVDNDVAAFRSERLLLLHLLTDRLRSFNFARASTLLKYDCSCLRTIVFSSSLI